MTIMTESRFAAAHRLHGEQYGKCNNLHGHTYTVQAEIGTGDIYNRSMVLNFYDFDAILNKVLDQFDHKTVLEIDDPLARYLKDASMDVYLMRTPPTSENLAELIYCELRMQLPAGVYIKQITVFESPRHSAQYSKEGREHD